MEKYLVVITTVLVITQVIRLLQNTMQLNHLKRKIGQDNEVVDKWERMADAIEKLIERLDNES